MSDWSDACDPVPARRELTEKQKQHEMKRAAIRRMRREYMGIRDDPVTGAFVDPDFEHIGYDE
jgi:hypothetical protein